MTATATSRLLTALLHRLPTRVVKALDAWSYRVAQERARKRREAGLRLAQQRSAS